MGELEETTLVQFQGVWTGEGTPLCTLCGRPYLLGQYYCQHCGEAVGNLTPYVPYVNIPFNYRPFAEIWRRLTRPEGRSFFVLVLYLLFLLLVVPQMVILALGYLFVVSLKGLWGKGSGGPPGEEVTQD